MDNIMIISARADHGGGPKHIDILLKEFRDKDLLNSFHVAAPLEDPYGVKWQKMLDNYISIEKRKIRIDDIIKLKKYIKKNNITIIHSHGKGAGAISRILKLTNWKLEIIHTFHGVHFGKKQILNFLYSCYEKLASKITLAFISVSETERKKIIELGIENGKVKVIPNGIYDPVDWGKSRKNKKFNSKLKVITISRFDYAKNMELCYLIAKGTTSDFEFIWVGDGPDKLYLQERAESEQVNIRFVGFTDNVQEYLKDADIYLSTSRWEGLPIAVIEAMANGLPVVATNVEGNKDLVKERYNGLLFEKNDFKKGIEKLNLLNTKRNLLEYYSANSRNLFEMNYKAQMMAEDVIKLYRKNA